MNIYELELHEEVKVADQMTSVTRVPGGWIYVFWSPAGQVASSFVPFNNEFQTDSPND